MARIERADKSEFKKQIRVPFDDPRIPPLATCNYFKWAKPDTRSAYDSGQSSDLQKCLDFRAAAFCRDMIKHKKLNDANDIFHKGSYKVQRLAQAASQEN